MGCISGIVRTVMFVFNFACLLVGIVLIAVGSVFYISVDQYDKIIQENSGFNIVPSLVIAVGVIVFIISFCGCCGAIKNNTCMLTTYAVILIILLIIQLVAGIMGIVKSEDEDLEKTVMKELRKGFKNYKEPVVQEVFQSVQSSLECCGVDSPLDYTIVLKWEIGKYAGGCCGKPNDDECTIKTEDVVKLKGCGDQLVDVIKSSIKSVGIVALAICGIELLGAIFAICLVKSK